MVSYIHEIKVNQLLRISPENTGKEIPHEVMNTIHNINTCIRFSSSHFHMIFSFLNLKHFFWGAFRNSQLNLHFSKELISSSVDSLLRYCKSINAIHVIYKKSENLRLNYVTF